MRQHNLLEEMISNGSNDETKTIIVFETRLGLSTSSLPKMQVI